MSVSAKQLAKLYFDKGLSVELVAKRVGLSPPHVSMMLRRAGYELRSLSESSALRYSHGKANWLKVARDFAKKKGGACLSTKYEDAHAPMKWRCAKGHRWTESLQKIRRSFIWCHKCAAESK